VFEFKKAVPILIATSNPGKLRDFAAAATGAPVNFAPMPDFLSLPLVEENEPTFEANARAKAEFYSRFAPAELVLADDSGLEVAALHGAPGVRSARYAADAGVSPRANSQSSTDVANNEYLLQELARRGTRDRRARFVCVIAAAKNGKTLQTFEGAVRGEILTSPRGHDGFGYDPLFLVPELGKTLAELSADQKAQVSHRGAAFRKFLQWFASQWSEATSR
jgi:XTP/dITP diphosphohydrolase